MRYYVDKAPNGINYFGAKLQKHRKRIEKGAVKDRIDIVISAQQKIMPLGFKRCLLVSKEKEGVWYAQSPD